MRGGGAPAPCWAEVRLFHERSQPPVLHLCAADMHAVATLRECIVQARALDDLTSTAVDDWVATKGLEQTTRTESAAFREAFTALLECLPDEKSSAFTSDAASDAVCKAMGTLFGLSVSQSGTAVHVRQGVENTANNTAVLIVGFGGASMLELDVVDSVYAKLRPSWRTVMTTMTALRGKRADELREAQLSEVARALADCDHVYVHSMSNNGFGAWQQMARRTPELAAKVRGFVFDCGVVVGSAMDESTWREVFSKSARRFRPQPDAPSRGCCSGLLAAPPPPRPFCSLTQPRT